MSGQHAAIDHQYVAGNIVGCRRCQKHRGAFEIIGVPQSAQWYGGFHGVDYFIQTLGRVTGKDARGNGIDSDRSDICLQDTFKPSLGTNHLFPTA